MMIAHLTLDLRTRNECRDRVDHDDIDRVGPDERFDDIECLFATVRLEKGIPMTEE
jgi:hypothetical protein